jgi:[acyl-carrier-protein] S-malonyltransferase
MASTWAALFPGQGSQSVGMGRFLFDEFATARRLFEEAGDTLKQDFKKLCFEGPEADLQLTENTQPALLLVSTVTFNVVKELTGVEIMASAGHSVGEYAAVATAGVISFSNSLRAVRTRGISMQKAVPVGQGAMAAVMGLNEEQVLKLCQWAEKTTGLKPLEPANFNAPGQVVISGSASLLEWLRANTGPENLAQVFDLKSDQTAPRVKLIPLAVSAPFHCSLMKPAEDEMRLVLSSMPFANANWPVVQNFSAKDSTDGTVLRDNLVRQISGAVRWTGCMARLKETGANRFIEFGSGKVLSGLAKKIDSNAETPFNINTLDDLRLFEAALRKGPVS